MFPGSRLSSCRARCRCCCLPPGHTSISKPLFPLYFPGYLVQMPSDSHPTPPPIIMFAKFLVPLAAAAVNRPAEMADVPVVVQTCKNRKRSPSSFVFSFPLWGHGEDCAASHGGRQVHPRGGGSGPGSRAAPLLPAHPPSLVPHGD